MKIKVVITGPRACGKSHTLRQIQNVLEFEGWAGVVIKDFKSTQAIGKSMLTAERKPRALPRSRRP